MTTPTPTPTPAQTPQQNLAQAMVTQMLDQWGLGSLGTVVWNAYLNGTLPSDSSGSVSPDTLAIWIRSDTQAAPLFYQRFPALKQLEAEGRAIAPLDYVNYENGVKHELTTWGFPQGVYSDNEITQMLLGNVSAQQAVDRIKTAAAVAYTSPPEVQATFNRLYGTNGPGALAAFLMDPEIAQPKLEQMASAAILGGAASAAGLGTLSKDQAEQYAAATTLHDPTQAFAAAANVAGQRTAYDNLYGQGGKSQASATDALAAQLGDAKVAGSVAAQQKARQAAYSGGGQIAAGQSGVSGLTSATQ